MTTKPTVKIVTLTNTRDPVVRRREVCVEKLEDQKKLLNDSAYVRVTQRNKKGSGPVEHRQIVRPWWSGVTDGVQLRLRFMAGAQGFQVGSVKDLPAAIDSVIEQIRSGELDSQIAVVKKEKKGKPLNAPVKLPGKAQPKKKAA